jgi:signal transduction histidine kinase
LLDRLRFVDYCRTEEIAAARDQLAKLDDAKTRFSANVHHELRTPLTLLLAPLDGLHDGDYGPLGQETQKIIRTMRSNGERLLKLINNLLDLAKLEDSKFSITRLPLSVTDLLEDLADGTRAVAKLKHISIDTSSLGELAPVFADRDALDKVFLNLLGNALKFTESGGSISIEGENVDGGVVVRIVDSGIGLEPAQLNRIFDRFAQVDTSTTRKHEGTGIGLSLASELIGLHEGRLWASSPGIGQGTTMSVEIPTGELDSVHESALAAGEETSLPHAGNTRSEIGESETSPSASPDASAPTERKFQDLDFDVRRWADHSGTAVAQRSSLDAETDERSEILVVDDNSDMRELLSHILGKRFRVRTARNGREALEILETYKPLLVVTDIMMPEISGTELCEKIKSTNRLKEIPVMIISSKAEREMKVRGLELGADDYVTKPFHAREVLARASSLVNLRIAQNELRLRNTQLETAIDGLRDAQARLVQSERLAAVGEIAAGIAHEVNNPVNFALNAARALRASTSELQEVTDSIAGIDWSDEEKLPKQGLILQSRIQELGFEDLTGTVVELTSIIEQGLERTRLLVGDLRDFASPNQNLQHREFDLRASTRDTARLFGHEMASAAIHLDISLPDEPMTTSGDESALGQVVLNLLKNASEAFALWDDEPADHSRRIEIVGKNRASEIVLEVKDNGPGIDPADIPRLFEPFFTTKEVGVGTGLGLSACKGITSAHGGTIEVDSNLGGGSVFKIVLPRVIKGPAPQ